MSPPVASLASRTPEHLPGGGARRILNVVSHLDLHASGSSKRCWGRLGGWEAGRLILRRQLVGGDSIPRRRGADRKRIALGVDSVTLIARNEVAVARVMPISRVCYSPAIGPLSTGRPD